MGKNWLRLEAEQLDIYEFGRRLVETGDLDPVYILLHQAQLEDWQFQRWLLAYWCFYHVGTASWITEGNTGYWQRMEQAAASKEYPRSAERRHFRGAAARVSVSYLKGQGLANLFAPLLEGPYTAKQVIEAVKKWTGFGPWIAFKVADMLERLGLCEVAFDIDTVMYESPQKGAECLWANEMDDEEFIPKDVGSWAATRILTRLGHLKAPPRYERLVNLQEVETILCKWKSMLNGHYHVGEDIVACRRSLERFPRCRIAQRLLEGGQKGGLW